jgi:hypothetical protein
MSVFLDKPYEYRTKLSNAKFSKRISYCGLRVRSQMLQRVRVDRPVMKSQDYQRFKSAGVEAFSFMQFRPTQEWAEINLRNTQ